MYEWLATERIASYQREAAQDRRFRLDTAQPSSVEAPVARATGPLDHRGGAPSTRRALAAAFVGLAAIGALRRGR